MEAIFSEYVIGIIDGALTIGFCLYVVGKQLLLKIKVQRIVLFVLLLAIAGSAFNIIVQEAAVYLLPFQIDYSGFSLPFWIVFGYLGLRRTTHEPGGRLMFVLLLSIQVMHFCRSFTYWIYSLWWPQLLSGTFRWRDIAGFGLPSLLLTPLLALAGRALYFRLRAVETGRHVHLWLLPLFFFLLYSAQVDLYPIEEYSFAYGLKILIHLSAFVTYSQTAWAVSNASKAAKESEICAQLTHQLDLQRVRMNDLESYAEEINRIHHDHRQHIRVLQSLLQEGKTGEALDYLSDYEESIAQSSRSSLCDHFVVDTLCRRYETLAKQAGVQVFLDISLPKDPKVAGSDLAVILGNLWENALDASLDAEDKHRFIRLQIQALEEQVMIRMKNGYSGVIIHEDERFLSSKPGRNQSEGVGIASIQTVAEKYGGMAYFTYTSDTFTASVLLYTDKD